MNEPSASNPSTIAAYGRAIANAVDQQGVSAEDVFEEAGVQLAKTADPLQRLTHEEVSRLFRAAVKATGNPAFGLEVGRSMHPSNLHALGYALMSSATIRSFCERLVNYYQLVSQHAVISLEENSSEVILVTTISSTDICNETQDAFVAMLVQLIRFIYDPGFSPLRVELYRPEPGKSKQAYQDFFRCDMSFGMPDVRIAIARQTIDKPLAGASKELAQMHDQTVRKYLQQLERRDIVNRVRAVIVDELSSGSIVKQNIANALHMSARNLQLKLAAKGTTFQEILDNTRHSLALGYIEQSGISITEITYLLGFSDVSNFTRAFKRWTKKSPMEYRQSIGL